MKYNIFISKKFKRNAKPLLKKYIFLKEEIKDLILFLEKEPKTGILLGDNCYKIKLSIKSKRKGKSGGARVITYVQIIDKEVFLLTIYDKSEKENISKKEINLLLKNIEIEKF